MALSKLQLVAGMKRTRLNLHEKVLIIKIKTRVKVAGK